MGGIWGQKREVLRQRRDCTWEVGRFSTAVPTESKSLFGPSWSTQNCTNNTTGTDPRIPSGWKYSHGLILGEENDCSYTPMKNPKAKTLPQYATDTVVSLSRELISITLLLYCPYTNQWSGCIWNTLDSSGHHRSGSIMESRKRCKRGEPNWV